MSKKKSNKPKFHLYEFPLYWLVTGAIAVLAIPVLIFKFIAFLFTSAGAPFQSAKNILGLFLLLSIVSAAYVSYLVFAPIDLGSDNRSVMVEENEHFRTIARRFHRSGIVTNEHIFRAAAVLDGVDKNVLPGRYDFKGNVSIYDVLRKIKRHDIATLLLTIPEGSTIFKIGSILANNLGIDSAAFVSRAMDTSFTLAKYHLPGLEGYLFPETYLLWLGIKADGVIDKLVGEFQMKTLGVLDSCQTNNLSPRQVLILASIIEGEALHEDEMPLISSVYHNRLRINMMLQADPTVNYALGGINRSLSYNDLKMESPYNTYLRIGLPPGPINSPGIDAIRAAMNPAKTDFLYFVADGFGRHIFSRTLEEHNRARFKIKKMRNLSEKNHGM